jgi:hypothetical protein
MSKYSAGSLLKLGAGLFGAVSQYKAGKDAKKASRRNAERIRKEAAEKRRRESRSQKQKQSTLRARAAASGIKISGSTKNFLDDYINEDEKQLSWMTSAAESNADMMKKAGKAAKKNASLGAYGSFFSAASQWWET